MYIELKDLGVYKEALELGVLAWDIYQSFLWQTKKLFGDQFVQAVDSVGANIAEGYGRFHYLDRIKFFYNARGSLLESLHWIEIIFRRKLISEGKYKDFLKKAEKINHSLNLYINSLYRSKDQK